jgi:hypothetical protein
MRRESLKKRSLPSVQNGTPVAPVAFVEAETMKGRHFTGFAGGIAGVVAASCACACILSSPSACATQERPSGRTVMQPQPQAATPTPYVTEEAEAYNGPNRSLIGTGLVTLGLSYIPAVVVASKSTQPADHHLFVPVAGPWLNLANRPPCGGEGIACDAETTNKVLLGVDGVFQGIGVLTTLAGIFSPEHEAEVVTSTGKPSVHVSPARMGVGGYGVTAFGAF